ncbi:MAG: hypothetical protein HY247_05000 [archaeon]|nr:MAG: hypothetical protein HY247_05000 [archaeon]
MAAYQTWEQVAGYFDGDGSILISDTSNQPFKLGMSLQFVDQSREQILMLQNFLIDRGVKTSNILKTSKGTANMLSVGSRDSVIKTLREMAPYLFKKEREAFVTLEYLEGKITGNQLFTAFQLEVEAGRRERRGRTVMIDVPYTQFEGEALMKARRNERLARAIVKTRSKVSESDYFRIRRENYVLNWTLRDILEAHPQYSKETIRRILGRGRGYVLVKGRGIVKADNR